MIEHTTPGTRITWVTLEDWIAGWLQLQRRRLTSARSQALREHLRALPRELIEGCYELQTVLDAEDLVRHAWKDNRRQRWGSSPLARWDAADRAVAVRLIDWTHNHGRRLAAVPDFTLMLLELEQARQRELLTVTPATEDTP